MSIDTLYESKNQLKSSVTKGAKCKYFKISFEPHLVTKMELNHMSSCFSIIIMFLALRKFRNWETYLVWLHPVTTGFS